MIPHYVYDQLAMVGLLWLYVRLHDVWPRRGPVSPPPPGPPVPPLLKRKRANALTPWALYQHCPWWRSVWKASAILM